MFLSEGDGEVVREHSSGGRMMLATSEMCGNCHPELATDSYLVLKGKCPKLICKELGNRHWKKRLQMKRAWSQNSRKL